jgi:hypothetical protein
MKWYSQWKIVSNQYWLTLQEVGNVIQYNPQQMIVALVAREELVRILGSILTLS